MIERKSLLSFQFYKKSAFTGSYKEMRYRIVKITEDGQDFLLATTYPQPLCFDATDDSLKVSSRFDFSEQGLCDATDWLNAQYTESYVKKQTP